MHGCRFLFAGMKRQSLMKDGKREVWMLCYCCSEKRDAQPHMRFHEGFLPFLFLFPMAKCMSSRNCRIALTSAKQMQPTSRWYNHMGKSCQDGWFRSLKACALLFMGTMGLYVGASIKEAIRNSGSLGLR